MAHCRRTRLNHIGSWCTGEATRPYSNGNGPLDRIQGKIRNRAHRPALINTATGSELKISHVSCNQDGRTIQVLKIFKPLIAEISTFIKAVVHRILRHIAPNIFSQTNQLLVDQALHFTPEEMSHIFTIPRNPLGVSPDMPPHRPSPQKSPTGRNNRNRQKAKKVMQQPVRPILQSNVARVSHGVRLPAASEARRQAAVSDGN